MSHGFFGGARRLVWRGLALTHRLGMFGVFNRLANRFTRSEGTGSSSAFPFVRRRRGRNVQILAYHRVARRGDSFLPAMPLRVFERQMECLAQRFRVIDLEDAVEALARDDVPDNAVVITFDDGYRDNYELAFPVLTGLSLKATVFLATGVVGTHRVLWHDRAFRAFNETNCRVLRDFGPDRATLILENPDRKQAALASVLALLRSVEPDTRDAYIDELVDKLEIEESSPCGRLMLGWEEVQKMQRGGISIGAHTVTHPILSRIAPDRARWEIAESKRDLESRLRTRVTAFAYPNGRAGDFDANTKRSLEDAGFRCAVTTIFGTNSRGGQPDWDPYELRRAGPDAAAPALFSAQMNVYKLLS